MTRVLAIGLDGFDLALAERLFAEGRLPHLKRLRDTGLSARLDHGRDKLSGLAWEHVSTGLAPSDGGRWSAVRFDAADYDVVQEETQGGSFLPGLGRRVVAFDLPYCRLSGDDQVMGLASWGAHDPGVEAHSNPAGLAGEIRDRFGPYPAKEFIYGFCWPSVERTEALGAALAKAVDLRGDIALWLLKDRLPDWDLALVVPSEAHSGSEPLWHGVDPNHPLHKVGSADAAGQGLVAIYEALDRLVGRLHEAFPDVAVMAFSMHGMGANEADVGAMALLPELLYRRAFGSAYMRDFIPPKRLPDGTPLLGEEEGWESTLRRLAPWPNAPSRWAKAWRKLGIGRQRDADALLRQNSARGIGWMPATRYRDFWPEMDAFALPAFYDGQIRVNLIGRESRGRVPVERYGALLDELDLLLSQCRDPLTGEPAVRSTHRPERPAHDLGPYEADLYVLFNPGLLGLAHERLGTIGPLPWRRTGGHSGEWGFLFGAGPGIPAGGGVTASSFDVVPTIIALLGEAPDHAPSGKPLVPRLTGA